MVVVQPVFGGYSGGGNSGGGNSIDGYIGGGNSCASGGA